MELDDPNDGEWTLAPVTDPAMLESAPILVYEEMVEDVPTSVSTTYVETGFADPIRLPYVKGYHLVMPAIKQVVSPNLLKKVSLVVLFVRSIREIVIDTRFQPLVIPDTTVDLEFLCIFICDILSYGR